MTIMTFLSSILLIAGILLLFNLSPDRVTQDISQLFFENPSIHVRSEIVKGTRKEPRMVAKLESIKASLFSAKNNKFGSLCVASVLLFVFGILIAVAVGNIFLIPVFAVLFALIPFLYAMRTISLFKRSIEIELETAVSIITTSYIRSGSIINAVEENLEYIKPPVRDVFRSFYNEVVYISPDIKQAIRNMQSKIDNAIFYQWCDTLISCQENDNFRKVLIPIVSKFSSVRIINAELKTIAYESKREFFLMVLISAVSFLFVLGLGPDWYGFLFTLLGKALIAIYLVVILICTFFVFRVTQPIEYRR